MSSKIAILQTCDPDVYAPVLDITGGEAQDYANRHGYDYFQYRGIWKNLTDHPRDATMNRIWWLPTFINSKWDYLFYMDADALVVDKTKRLEDVVGNDHSFAYCGNNIGVMGINLRHRDTITTLYNWVDLAANANFRCVRRVDDPSVSWIRPNDQGLFLKASKGLDSVKIFDSEDPKSPLWRKTFNFNGPFIEQVMRGKSPTIEAKIEGLGRLLPKGSRGYDQ